MLYLLIKIPVRLALAVFCRKIDSGPSGLYRTKGPLLLVANHPNSFLDAVIIGSRFARPVHFLARGDAFQKPRHRRWLGWLNMIPVYRLSEGKENLALNDHAFKRCSEILARNGIVLIFIEGICVNSHTLQPFKKGAARIAMENRCLPGFRVLPVGIAYDSLHGIGKTVRISMGNTSSAEELLPYAEEAKNLRCFNDRMLQQLAPLVLVPRPAPANGLKNLLLLPAVIGYLLHIVPFSLVRMVVSAKTQSTVFYDSVLFASLLLLYPFYLLLITLLLAAYHVSFIYLFFITVAFPALASGAVHFFKEEKPEISHDKLIPSYGKDQNART
ncbi:1-acyl-sn-glycerol-3-phosphate acyltransferase [Sediminibacterium soli]|uniref:1-acyl-sn-glycerol-3-phosphate acyltransferase n=1 Tax=Sediminibacterium soli TaxID=2698829 RepID=UPI00137B0350|nr:1-acyl-sn-glycerol-3-phosphate acyltransferase [Sediminibacterium soli]NCI47870.1 hypothetical protein [Sediminibacterium soli]